MEINPTLAWIIKQSWGDLSGESKNMLAEAAGLGPQDIGIMDKILDQITDGELCPDFLDKNKRSVFDLNNTPRP